MVCLTALKSQPIRTVMKKLYLSAVIFHSSSMIFAAPNSVTNNGGNWYNSTSYDLNRQTSDVSVISSNKKLVGNQWTNDLSNFFINKYRMLKTTGVGRELLIGEVNMKINSIFTLNNGNSAS